MYVPTAVHLVAVLDGIVCLWGGGEGFHRGMCDPRISE